MSPFAFVHKAVTECQGQEAFSESLPASCQTLVPSLPMYVMLTLTLGGILSQWHSSFGLRLNFLQTLNSKSCTKPLLVFHRVTPSQSAHEHHYQKRRLIISRCLHPQVLRF